MALLHRKVRVRGNRGVPTVVRMYVTVVEEVGKLRGVVCGPAFLDYYLVRRGCRPRGRGLYPRVAFGLGSHGVWGLHPGGELVDEVLVFAPACHRDLPVIVKNLPRPYISTLPFLIPPSRTLPSTMMCTPSPEGEIST